MLGGSESEGCDALIVAPSVTNRRSSWSSLGLQLHNENPLAPSGALVQPHAVATSVWTDDESHSGRTVTLEKEDGIAAYEVLDDLGQGSFAKCVRIRQIDTGLVFAGKLCPKRQLTVRQQKKLNRLGDETKLGLLGVATEIEIHSSLSHHNIIRFHEHFFDRATSKLCMVLEYCAHGPLRRILQRVPAKALPQVAVQRWMFMLMDATNHMHSCGIAHRDINPDNILIDENLALKVCDFGFAVHVTTAGQHTNPAAAAEAVGTLNYIAPEVLLRDSMMTGGADLRAADVWACGVVMHEALLGRVPFLLQEDEYPAVEVLRPLDAPAPLCVEAVDFIAATLHRTPDCRPTAEALLDHAFFGGSFCAFPGTKAEIELRTAAAEMSERGTSPAAATQHDAVLALPPSPPQREDLAVVAAATDSTNLPSGRTQTQMADRVELAGVLANLPTPSSQSTTKGTVVPIPVATAHRVEPWTSPVQQQIRSPGNRRALAISPARRDPVARMRHESHGGRDEYQATVAAALESGPSNGSNAASVPTITVAAAKHQPLASGLLQTLGVSTLGVDPASRSKPTSSTTARDTTSSSMGGGNMCLDEELMSWVLLLQLDPLLDARWIAAAQQRIQEEAAAMVATLSDDDSGSDGDVTAGSDGEQVVVSRSAVATVSPANTCTSICQDELVGLPQSGQFNSHSVIRQQDHQGDQDTRCYRVEHVEHETDDQDSCLMFPMAPV